MHAMAAALARLPARVVWKVSNAELARAGGVASLNVSANVKVWPRLPSSYTGSMGSSGTFCSCTIECQSGLCPHAAELVRLTLQTWPWVPQNDLLGHPSTRAFLTHCGSNGMYEVRPLCAECR